MNSSLAAESLVATSIDGSGLADLEHALAEVRLPAADIALPGRQFWRFDRRPGDVVGYGGLECTGFIAIIRSIVVLPPHRGLGLGATISSWLLNAARSQGVGDVFLLTTNATGFFERLGFRPFDRRLAPEAVRSSAQFAVLCPASAVLMAKTLRP